MLKLIIADDEHWVCQLIENLLPWNDLGNRNRRHGL